MIMQKFVSTTGLINQIVDGCLDEEFQQFMIHFFDNLDFIQIDKVVDSVRVQTSRLFEQLSQQKSIDDCVKIINRISFNEKFALNQYLTVGALYKEFHVEKLPLFPLEKLPFNFFAYLEASYQDFHSNCLRRGASTAEEVFALSLDNFEQQNI